MPELPEVETVRRDLERAVRGKRIARVSVLNPGSVGGATAATFGAALAGQRFAGFGRRGKYLLAALGSGTALVIHLRMTGVLLHQSANDPLPAMARIVFHLRGGTRLVFADQRKFGSMQLAADPLLVPGISKLGPEPLDPTFTAVVLRDRLRGRKGPVKTALLDQSVVAGLGNIYVLEALHRAGIAPQRRAGALKRDEETKLHRAIVTVLRDAIKSRGSSVDTYRDGQGKRGWFQVKHLVYDREGRSCRRCGAIIVKEQFRGRGTYWCPKCQH
ncbi:MAG TPA: bifunctional DNA-formamidopyrimidine glycosylase/DNA-(apurinic or apyrimidinic site) lyase [Candidatus Edwardsbacteria bacterium]|nr:bifunctional DNA-formamidopyrimidine glycosylase/DNA-(apurinic or apyrimidinic site) lyase [Candidatus Edwardsbacteria bacterium]